MQALNPNAQKVMEILVDGLRELGHHKKVDNTNGAFMPVSVELVDKCSLGLLFSVAHYYEQNGDLMRDPEMVFLRGGDGRFYPVYFLQDSCGMEQESADVHAGTFRAALQAGHASFANTWMRNIKEQQHL